MFSEEINGCGLPENFTLGIEASEIDTLLDVFLDTKVVPVIAART